MYEKYGKNQLKKHQISPDAVAQLCMIQNILTIESVLFFDLIVSFSTNFHEFQLSNWLIFVCTTKSLRLMNPLVPLASRFPFICLNLMKFQLSSMFPKGGRTETIRSATMSSNEFVRVMCDPQSSLQEREKKLRCTSILE
jgi:hypothetical protein